MRWLTVDPGDTTGLACWEDTELMGAWQAPNWSFIDALDTAGDDTPELVVCEDFLIYPWKCKDLGFNNVMTARVIGALMLMARRGRFELIFQGADIKETAVAGGAEELFLEPLHDNRHANDAIMHGVFYVQTVLLNPKNARVESGKLVPNG